GRGDVLGGRAEGVEDETREPRGEDGVPTGHAAHRVGELGRGDGLGHVPAGAGPDDTDDVLAGVRHRQREEAGRHVPAAGDDVDTAPATTTGQVDVEQDDVGAGLADDGDGGLDVG